jgi:hypothetical protein
MDKSKKSKNVSKLEYRIVVMVQMFDVCRDQHKVVMTESQYISLPSTE